MNKIALSTFLILFLIFSIKLKKEKNANFNYYLAVYQKLWAECLETQKTYDSETRHGQLVEANDEWINTINTELNSID